MPLVRCAFRSATGSLPSATASLIPVAIRRAAVSGTRPTCHQRGRPSRLYTTLKARCPDGWMRSSSPGSFASQMLNGDASGFVLVTVNSVSVCLRVGLAVRPSLLGRGMSVSPELTSD